MLVSCIRKTKMLVGVTLLGVLFVVFPMEALLRGQDRQPGELPEGKGKELVASVCIGCHALNTVTARKKTRSEWESTVSDMIGRGAQISADEAKSIADYLGAQFGPGSPAPSPASTSTGTDPAAAFPDAPGKDVLMAKCFQCHNEGMWKTLRQDKIGWKVSIYPMDGRGALWSEEEIEIMTDYLATAFGPKSAQTPQAQTR